MNKNKKYLFSLVSLLLILTNCSKRDKTSSGEEISVIPSQEEQESDSMQLSNGESQSHTSTSSISYEESDTSSSNPIDDSIQTVGLENTSSIIGHYFNPLKGVKVTNSIGEDITYLLSVVGNVDYGTKGSYALTYKINYLQKESIFKRIVDIVDGNYVAENAPVVSQASRIVTLGSGSYNTGDNANIEHTEFNMNFVDPSLRNQAVETTTWWSSLLTANYGGSNSIFNNPLRTSFSGEGIELSKQGKGTISYATDGTVHQYMEALKDMMITSTNLSNNYTTSVVDYSDNAVKVSMKKNNLDEMVVSIVQGSPYLFFEVKDKTSAKFTIPNAGMDGIEFYDLNGNKIDKSSYNGDSIIVKLVKRHVGYQFSSETKNIMNALYEDRFFLVNAPSSTTFNLSSVGMPNGNNNTCNMQLGYGNYFSISPINGLQEANFYHEHGYAHIHSSYTNFKVDHATSKVITKFNVVTNYKKEENMSSSILALMPHQYKKSTDASLTSYSTTTVRGLLKIMSGNSYSTELSFYGMLPSLTAPANDSFNDSLNTDYLNDLCERVSSDMENTDSLYGKSDPYWDSKAIYPLAQGIINADQTGNSIHKNILLSYLKDYLSDYFTYSGNNDSRFLYYNSKIHSMYYSHSDFGVSTRLDDHHFTHGYLILASSIVAMYDKEFYNSYKEIIETLLYDYMNPIKEDESMYPYLRTFDPWAGHSWASGFSQFAEGNNQESCGEALNSWVGGYLIGIANNDMNLIDTAIYGFTSEMYSIKQYWFDYDQNVWDSEYRNAVGVNGMVWSGKQDYATWFGANPTFIYGIHWLPIGEYLTSYALGADQSSFSRVYSKYLTSKNNTIDTWFSNMWTMQSLVDSSKAVSLFEGNKIMKDDYPNEVALAYYYINAMDTYKNHTDEVSMKVNSQVASSVYKNGQNEYIAMLWNPSSSDVTCTFSGESQTYQAVAKAHSFTQVKL